MFLLRLPFDNAIPTTFYVDHHGTFLETRFSGAYPEMYEDVLVALLYQL